MSIILNIVLGFITGGLLLALKYEYDKRTKLEERLYGDKRAFYGLYLEMLSGVLWGRKKQQIKNQEFKSIKKLEEFMGKFKFMMMLNSSDEAYRSFANYAQKAFKGEKLSPKEMGKLFLAFRKDTLGKTDLSPKEILSTFITDIEKIK